MKKATHKDFHRVCEQLGQSHVNAAVSLLEREGLPYMVFYNAATYYSDERKRGVIALLVEGDVVRSCGLLT